MSKYIKIETVQRAADFIGSKPVGVNSAEVAAHMGMGRKIVSNILCHGRGLGMLHWVCAKQGCKQDGLWATAENLAATQKRVAEIVVEQAAMSKERHRLRVREYLARKKYGDDVPDPPFVHRVVPADGAQPIKCRAPASVWALGAMA